MFFQLVTLRLGNTAGSGYLAEDQREYVYYFIQLFVIAGFLCYAPFDRSVRDPKVRKALGPALFGVCLISAALLLFVPPSAPSYLAVTAVAVFFLGIAGAAVYARMARYAAVCPHIGLSMGAGYSAAILLQYLLQLRFSVVPLIFAVLVLSCFTAAYLLLKQPPDEGERPEEEEEKGSAHPVLRFAAVSAIALMLLFFCSYYNNYIHRLQIASQYGAYSVYTWPRLLLIPSMLIFGAVGDVRKGRFLPITSLCVAVLALLNALLNDSAETYWFNMCLYYLSLSAAIAYYHLAFWRLPAKRSVRVLGASAGRILDSVAVLVAGLIGISAMSSAAVLALNIAALAVVIVLMALNGDFDLTGRKARAAAPPEEENASAAPREEEPKSAEEERDVYALIAERYRLTPSEIRVFRELVLTEDKQLAIAERLSIKVRTVQANVTSIYRKTGVSTRSGLVQLLHDLTT